VLLRWSFFIHCSQCPPRPPGPFSPRRARMLVEADPCSCCCVLLRALLLNACCHCCELLLRCCCTGCKGSAQLRGLCMRLQGAAHPCCLNRMHACCAGSAGCLSSCALLLRGLIQLAQGVLVWGTHPRRLPSLGIHTHVWIERLTGNSSPSWTLAGPPGLAPLTLAASTPTLAVMQLLCV